MMYTPIAHVPPDERVRRRAQARAYARAHRAHIRALHKCYRKPRPHVLDAARALADLFDEIGGDAILAAHILKQAISDLRALRAGQKFNPFYYPYYIDPAGELQNFFAGEWFGFLAAHLGFDRAALLRMIDR